MNSSLESIVGCSVAALQQVLPLYRPNEVTPFMEWNGPVRISRFGASRHYKVMKISPGLIQRADSSWIERLKYSGGPA